MVSIRELDYKDVDIGFLEVLDNLVSPEINSDTAKKILKEIKSNPFHKIFVVMDEEEDVIIGTTTLLIEPKFINKGIRVGYIEDVAIKKGYEGSGIGRQIVEYVTNHAKVIQNCRKILLYCSDKNKPFYEKLGYKVLGDTNVMKMEFD